MEIKFSPIQTEMLKILSDGLPHSPAELHKCMGPSSLSSMTTHLQIMRAKLLPLGETIVGEYNKRRCFYRHVKLLNGSSTVITPKSS